MAAICLAERAMAAHRIALAPVPGQSLFSINEEMGFTKEEIKSMVLKFPSLLKGTERADLNILNQFEILHNEAKIPHSIIAKFPESLIGRNIETK